MLEDLVDSNLPIARRSVVPGRGFFITATERDDRRSDRVRSTIEGAEVVVLADADADGLTSAALIRERYGDVHYIPTDDDDPSIDRRSDEATSENANDKGEKSSSSEGVDMSGVHPDRVVGVVPTAPHELEANLKRLVRFGTEGIDVFICDLCPDRFEPIEGELTSLMEIADSVRWFDHHQWDRSVETSVEGAGVELAIGDSETECTADVTRRSLNTDFDDHLIDLIAVTRDHDLWIRDDPRSDDIADFAYWGDPEVFIEVIRQYGPSLPEWVVDDLTERRVEKQAFIERAIDRAEYRTVGEYTVGLTYGRCSQNEVAESMRSAGADVSVIIKPAGSVSIRGTDRFERCHEVAKRLGGGGHPKAAGCLPDIYDDMLDFAHHWTTRGSVTKQVVIDAIRAVTDEPET